MDVQSSFQVMFDKLLRHLKVSNKVVEVSSRFGPHKELENMFKYVWELEEVHNYIQIAPVVINKSSEKAENLRKDGNKYYQKKILIKALECYNKSIIHSHQYDFDNSLDVNPGVDMVKIFPPEFLENSESKNLPLGYANRSAVLFELKNYEGCLLDISKAINHGYPSILRSKLVERQAKCYMTQSNKKKAKKVLNEGLLSLKKLDLEEEKIVSLQRSLETLLKKCDTSEDISGAEHDIHETCKNLFNSQVPEAPELLETNRDIPSLSDAVTLSYLPEKGRFLIANRDIMPGEILIKENGFSYITLPPSLLSHCSYCLQRTFTPVPCPFCSTVVFCSGECLSEALNRFHSTECTILPLIVALDLGRNAMLALRLITQIPLSELKQKVSQYEKTNEDLSRLGFNEQNVYSSEDYRTIYHLVTNKEQRAVSDLFKRSAIAACLVKLLMKTKYFGHCIENLNEIGLGLSEDIHIVGRVLFIHLMNLPCNAHSITELHVNTAKYQKSYIEEIGAGAFGVLSLTNHSCNPSLARSCYGRAVVAKAIQFIPKGTEVADSYGEHYAIRSKEERQNYLRQQYYFACSCEACTHGWCTYTFLTETVSFKCPDCSSSIILGASKCLHCDKSTSELRVREVDNEFSNLDALFSKIQNSVKMYNVSYENVLKGDISEETYGNIIDLILYISKYSTLPNRLVFEAQETLKHCFDRKGSHSYNT